MKQKKNTLIRAISKLQIHFQKRFNFPNSAGKSFIQSAFSLFKGLRCK